MEDNCFINSPVSASAINASSIVMVYSEASVTSVNNFIDAVQADLPCPFVIQTEDYTTFTCLNMIVFDATACSTDSSYTKEPVVAPSAAPVGTSPSAPTTPTPGAPTSAAAHGKLLFGVGACVWVVGLMAMLV
jgi:hypothetical protein